MLAVATSASAGHAAISVVIALLDETRKGEVKGKQIFITAQVALVTIALASFRLMASIIHIGMVLGRRAQSTAAEPGSGRCCAAAVLGCNLHHDTTHQDALCILPDQDSRAY